MKYNSKEKICDPNYYRKYIKDFYDKDTIAYKQAMETFEIFLKWFGKEWFKKQAAIYNPLIVRFTRPNGIEKNIKLIKLIYYCKNNIGSSVLDDSIPIITEKSLLKLFEKYNGNLKLINKKIRSRNYLPEWNKDFKILMEEIQYAGFKFVFPIIRLNIDNDIFIKDKNVKRNDPCPCGAINPKSQKRMKYKKCCGR